MPGRWDVVVVGAGAAGMSAAAAVARAGLSCLCLDRLGPGGLLINLGVLHDMPDLPEGTTGPDLLTSLLDPAMAAGVELQASEVRHLRRADGWTVETDDGEHQARAVIIASGLTPGLLGVEGEAGFEGRGLSHCAACDGPLYAGQDVVVAGADEWAAQEAIELAQVARRVTLVHGDDAPAVSPARAAALAALANVGLMAGRIVALEGGEGLQAVTVACGAGRERLPARAAFVYTQRIPATSFARGLLDLDGSGHMMVDEDLCVRPPSLFAAGDVRAGSPQRIAAAIADGERAGRAAANHLKAVAGEARRASSAS
jgi:thioredoxin reductase (NADPH)